MPTDDENKDDEVSSASEEDTESSGSNDAAADNDDKSSDDNEDDWKEAPAPFSMLDLRAERCFGWQPKANISCWYNLSLTGKANGWTEPLIQIVEKSLKQNVNDCYFCLA